jgi:hypothetical protein
MTPSLARMVLSRKGGLSFPLKWFAIPQCWRYERMTRGKRSVLLSDVSIYIYIYIYICIYICIYTHMKWFAIPQCWRYERMTRGIACTLCIFCKNLKSSLDDDDDV